MDEPILLTEVDDELIAMMAQEFATQATARILMEVARRHGPDADTGPEITDILMHMNQSSFEAGFKVAKRIHDAEREH